MPGSLLIAENKMDPDKARVAMIARPVCLSCQLAGLSLPGMEVAMAQLLMLHCSWHLGVVGLCK